MPSDMYIQYSTVDHTNLVVEEHILDTQERASDYERGAEILDDKGKAVMMTKLRQH